MVSVAETELLLAAVPVVAGIVWRYVIAPVRRAITRKHTEALATAKRKEDEYQMLLTRVEQIAYQVNPNGQGSMNDAIVRIEDRLILLEHTTSITLAESGLGTFVTSDAGQYTQVSAEYQRIAGCDDESALGMGWIDLLADESKVSAVMEWRESIKDKRLFRHPVRYRNGARAHVTAYPLRNRSGDIVKYLGIVRRMTS